MDNPRLVLVRSHDRMTNYIDNQLFGGDVVTILSGVHDLQILHCRGKFIYLFGERHNREESCEDIPLARGQYIEINDFIKNIVRYALHSGGENNLDLFLEQLKHILKAETRHHPREYMEFKDLGGLRAMADYIHVEQRRGRARGIRIHYTDIRDTLCMPFVSFFPGRDEPFSRLLTATLYAPIENSDRSAGELEFISGMQHPQVRADIINVLDQLFEKYIWTGIISFDESIGFLPNTLLLKEINSSMYPTEIRRIAEDAFYEITARERELKDRFLDGDVLDPTERWNLQTPGMHGERFNKLAGCIDDYYNKLWMWVHDIYTLARMFKPYTSETIIFYGGSTHTTNLSNYLIRLSGETVLYVAEAADGEHSCLRISESGFHGA